MDLLDTGVYELIREKGFTSLVAACYQRVRTDDVLSPMYPERDVAVPWRKSRRYQRREIVLGAR